MTNTSLLHQFAWRHDQTAEDLRVKSSANMSMEDLLFGSDLEESDEEEKKKATQEADREAQLNELFGDSPSEGEGEDQAVSDGEKEEDSGDEHLAESRKSMQDDRHYEESVRKKPSNFPTLKITNFQLQASTTNGYRRDYLNCLHVRQI